MNTPFSEMVTEFILSPAPYLAVFLGTMIAGGILLDPEMASPDARGQSSLGFLDTSVGEKEKFTFVFSCVRSGREPLGAIPSILRSVAGATSFLPNLATNAIAGDANQPRLEQGTRNTLFVHLNASFFLSIAFGVFAIHRNVDTGANHKRKKYLS